jgi:hypothetical protein
MWVQDREGFYEGLDLELLERFSTPRHFNISASLLRSRKN